MALSLACLDIKHVTSCPLQSCANRPLSRTSSFRGWHPSTSRSSNQQNTFGSETPCNVAVRASSRHQGGTPSLPFRSNYRQSRTSQPLKCSVNPLLNHGRLARKKKHILTSGGPSIGTAARGLANKTLAGGSLSSTAGSVLESEARRVCLRRFPSSSVSSAVSSCPSSSSAFSSSVHGRGTGHSGACLAPASSSTLSGRQRWRQADSQVVVTCVAPHNDAAVQTEVKDVLPAGAESANGVPAQAVIAKGSKVRVKGSLVVYHVPKQPVFDLIGKEGKVVDVVDTWKGKHISANFPYKVAFEMEAVGGGRPTKFFAHFVEEEIELVS